LFVIYYKQSHQHTTQHYYPTYYPTKYPTTQQQTTTTTISTEIRGYYVESINTEQGNRLREYSMARNNLTMALPEGFLELSRMQGEYLAAQFKKGPLCATDRIWALATRDNKPVWEPAEIKYARENYPWCETMGQALTRICKEEVEKVQLEQERVRLAALNLYEMPVVTDDVLGFPGYVQRFTVTDIPVEFGGVIGFSGSAKDGGVFVRDVEPSYEVLKARLEALNLYEMPVVTDDVLGFPGYVQRFTITDVPVEFGGVIGFTDSAEDGGVLVRDVEPPYEVFVLDFESDTSGESDSDESVEFQRACGTEGGDDFSDGDAPDFGYDSSDDSDSGVSVDSEFDIVGPARLSGSDELFHGYGLYACYCADPGHGGQARISRYHEMVWQPGATVTRGLEPELRTGSGVVLSGLYDCRELAMPPRVFHIPATTHPIVISYWMCGGLRMRFGQDGEIGDWVDGFFQSLRRLQFPATAVLMQNPEEGSVPSLRNPSCLRSLATFAGYHVDGLVFVVYVGGSPYITEVLYRRMLDELGFCTRIHRRVGH